MTRYILGRIAQALLVVLAAYTIAFFLLHLLPSNPVDLMLGPDSGDISIEQREALAAQYGLDQPVLVQYFQNLLALLGGDLGYSFQQGRSVADVLGEALPSTLQLAAASLVLTLVFGLGLGFIAASTRNSSFSQVLLGLPSLGVSIPTFWFGLILIQFLSFKWQLFPAFNAPGVAGLVLPAVTLALPTSAMIAQVFARSLIDTRRQPFVAAVRAKGASYFSVQLQHVARNAFFPVLTVLGLVVGQLFSGTVVIETVFSRPGLGRVIAGAVGSQDILVVLGAVLLGAVLYTLTNLAVDLIYPVIDPRLRSSIRARPRRVRRVSGAHPDDPAEHSTESRDQPAVAGPSRTQEAIAR